MKRIFLAAFLMVASASLINKASATTTSVVSLKSDGVHISASQVPSAVMQAFTTKFPTATNAKWEKEQEHGGTVYQVDFYKSGIRWRAVFAPNGTLLSSGKH